MTRFLIMGKESNHPEFGNKKYMKDSYFRKPNQGMILAAVKKWIIDLNKSYKEK